MLLYVQLEKLKHERSNNQLLDEETESVNRETSGDQDLLRDQWSEISFLFHGIIHELIVFFHDLSFNCGIIIINESIYKLLLLDLLLMLLIQNHYIAFSMMDCTISSAILELVPLCSIPDNIPEPIHVYLLDIR